ncbi:ABC transporter permease [Amorphoplanes nipponensis]|uniref:ABC transporter n=1 Tax=Actinoplanes nipponensis TaxID=135950 RepID=A0A919MRV9_9ACTN|nr:ABC transporter permease [Actinoplanes nipponensis]GIE47360.1 ABC transporter [Actinoplanes nipponensis]
MRGYLRLELRRTLRTPGFVIFTVAMPLVMYLVFTNLGTVTGRHSRDAALYAMISVGGFGAVGALLNYGASVVADRTSGWLRHLRLTPLSPLRVVLGKGLTGMLLAVPPVLALCLAAVLVNHVRLGGGQWCALVPLMWLGATPFVLLGLGLGYLCTAQTVQPANFVCYFGMSLLGGLWLPLQTFPAWLRRLGRLTPTHGYADMALRVVGFNSDPAGLDAAVLGAWSLAFAAFAVWAYRRSAARKDA